MKTGELIAEFVPLVSLYGACCCLCIIFWVWIEYLFSDPSENNDIKTRVIRLIVLVVAFVGLLLLSDGVQRF